MSRAPKPGAKLQKILKTETVIQSLIKNFVDTVPAQDPKVFDTAISAIIDDLVDDPDACKAVCEKLSQASEYYEHSADRFSNLALISGGVVLAIEDKLVTKIQAGKNEPISGETWKFSIVKERPEVIITNEKEIPAALKKTITIPDDFLILKAAEEEQIIPGVTVRERFGIQSTVIKKGA